MQKVTPKPYAPPKTGGTGKSIRLFSLRFHFISNRHALPETGTGVTQKPAYSVFDSILLNIVRNICPLVKRKTLPAEHFVQKNKNKMAAAGTPSVIAARCQLSQTKRAAPENGAALLVYDEKKKMKEMSYYLAAFSPSGKMILFTKKKMTMEMPPLRTVVPML